MRELLDVHPPFKRRFAALENPAKAFDQWWVTALLLGGLALILDIFLATPLTLPYHGRWPMHFSVLVIAAVVTLNLMTPLVLGRPTWRSMLKIIGVIVALRFAWLTVTVGLMFLLLILAPDLLSDILTSAITSIARYTRQLTGPVVDDLSAFVIESSFINFAQILIIVISLVLLIGISILLLKRLFTWYRFPNAQHRLLKVAYAIIAVTIISFGLTILTPVTRALLRPEDVEASPVMGGMVLGLIIALVGAGLFLIADRQYARRCPGCGAHVPGSYQLGKRCKACNELLHAWMIAEYET